MVKSLRPINASFTHVDAMDHLCVWVECAIYVCGLGMSHGFNNASQQNIGFKCARAIVASVRVCIHHSTPYPIRALQLRHSGWGNNYLQIASSQEARIAFFLETPQVTRIHYLVETPLVPRQFAMNKLKSIFSWKNSLKFWKK